MKFIFLFIFLVTGISAFGQSRIAFAIQMFRNTDQYNSSRGFKKTGVISFFDEGKGELESGYVSTNKKENGVRAIGYFKNLTYNEMDNGTIEILDSRDSFTSYSLHYMAISKARNGLYKFVTGIHNKENPNGKITEMGTITAEGYIKLKNYLKTNIVSKHSGSSSILSKFNLENFNPQIERTPGDFIANCLWYKTTKEMNANQRKNLRNFSDRVRFSWAGKDNACWIDTYANGNVSPQCMAPIGDLKDLILVESRDKKLYCIANNNKRGIVFAKPEESLQQGVIVEFKTGLAIIKRIFKTNTDPQGKVGDIYCCSKEDGILLLKFFREKLNRKLKEDGLYIYYEH